MPHTLCGEALDTSEQGQELRQEDLKIAELMFNPLVETTNIGSYTSAFSASYNAPAGMGVTRLVNLNAFNGHFNAQAIVQAMASLSSTTTEVFHAVPPGPHGGAMECARAGQFTAECAFGTATTAVDIEFMDTSGELVGAHAAATAIEIRDALEVGA
jgi:hypothetical protein